MILLKRRTTDQLQNRRQTSGTIRINRQLAAREFRRRWRQRYHRLQFPGGKFQSDRLWSRKCQPSRTGTCRSGLSDVGHVALHGLYIQKSLMFFRNAYKDSSSNSSLIGPKYAVTKMRITKKMIRRAIRPHTANPANMVRTAKAACARSRYC